MKRAGKKALKPRNFIVRDMLLTRKGGPMRDRRRSENNKALIDVGADIDAEVELLLVDCSDDDDGET